MAWRFITLWAVSARAEGCLGEVQKLHTDRRRCCCGEVIMFVFVVVAVVG